MPYALKSTDLKEESLITIAGIQGQQFGKEMYSSMLKFKDLETFLETFPEVQRNIVPRRVKSMKEYILSGVDDINKMRFFSAITVSCRGRIFYDHGKHLLAIDTNYKCSINDGQHRFEAIKEAINYLKHCIQKNERDLSETTRLKNQLSTLEEMVIPIVIFDGMSENEEKQLFFDLNNLSNKPSRSANIRLSQTDPFARMARELSEYNRYLKYFGVEMDKGLITRSNTNTVLLSTVHTIIRELLDIGIFSRSLEKGREVLSNENFDEVKEFLNSELDKIFFVLPPDINTKNKYILDKSYGLKGVIKYYNYAKTILSIDEKTVLDIIKITEFDGSVDSWIKYDGYEGQDGNAVFSSSNKGLKAVFSKLIDNTKEYTGVESLTELKA